MTMTHDALRKLAEAATPGDWKATGGDVWVDDREQVCCGQGIHECCGEPDITGGEESLASANEVDAAYIAAANPKKVLALLDRIAELEGAEKRIAERACEVVDAYSDYDAPYCCDGRMCGCEGQTVHDMMKHFILAMVKP